MGEGKGDESPNIEEFDGSPMTIADFEEVESTLNLTMPEPLKQFAMTERSIRDIDYEVIAGAPQGFIEMTLAYRAGFVGMPPWPNEWLCIGDDGTACPYAIDCVTERVLQLDHGNPERERLAVWDSFDDFLTEQQEICRIVEEELGDFDEQYGTPIPDWMYGYWGAVICALSIFILGGIFFGVCHLLNII